MNSCEFQWIVVELFDFHFSTFGLQLEKEYVLYFSINLKIGYLY
jgi:hypothetical protein